MKRAQFLPMTTNDEAQFLPVTQMIGSNDINDGAEVLPLAPNKDFFPTDVGTFSTPIGHKSLETPE
ncbi:unnamed protein product, partial [Staurois parvus]